MAKLLMCISKPGATGRRLSGSLSACSSHLIRAEPAIHLLIYLAVELIVKLLVLGNSQENLDQGVRLLELQNR